jgi:hypothetical protein
MKRISLSFYILLAAFSSACEKNKTQSDFSVSGEFPHSKTAQQNLATDHREEEVKENLSSSSEHLGFDSNAPAHSEVAEAHLNEPKVQSPEVASQHESSAGNESDLTSASAAEAAPAPAGPKQPAFLARKCDEQNEGEMGFNAKEHKAYFCNGSSWVGVKGFQRNFQKALTKLDINHVKGDSFLCLKSKEGSFRCMKGESFKNAH